MAEVSKAKVSSLFQLGCISVCVCLFRELCVNIYQLVICIETMFMKTIHP